MAAVDLGRACGKQGLDDRWADAAIGPADECDRALDCGLASAAGEPRHGALGGSQQEILIVAQQDQLESLAHAIDRGSRMEREQPAGLLGFSGGGQDRLQGRLLLGARFREFPQRQGKVAGTDEHQIDARHRGNGGGVLEPEGGFDHHPD